MDDLLAGLEAPVPSPAGGSAAAAVGAIAASLVVMVGRGSPDWPEGAAAADEAGSLRDRLVALGGDDVDAVAALLAAYRAAATAQGSPALDEARLDAARVPLEIAEAAAAVATLAGEAAAAGRHPMRPDADAAARLATEAARVATSIVELNLSGFAADDERPGVAALRERARAVPHAFEELA